MDELERLSPEELRALLRRQQEELAEREAAIARRDEKIRELEGELAQFRRPVKTPDNSSLPLSRDQKANRLLVGVGSPVPDAGPSGSAGRAVSRTWWSSAARARVRGVARRSPRRVDGESGGVR